MLKKINIIEAPAGSNKTMFHAFTIIKSPKSRYFIYVSPRIELNKEFEETLKGDGISCLRVDSTEGAILSQFCSLSDDTSKFYKCILVTHASMKYIPVSLLQGRELILDEIPDCLQIEDLTYNRFKEMLDGGYIETISLGQFPWPSCGNVIRVSKKGKELIKSHDRDIFDSAARIILKKIEASSEKEAYYDQHNNVFITNHLPLFLTEALSVTLLCASKDAGLFCEWSELTQIKIQNISFPEIKSEVLYSNIEIYFLEKNERFSSITWLTSKWRKNEGNNDSRRINTLAYRIKNSFLRSGSLEKNRAFPWIIALNKSIQTKVGYNDIFKILNLSKNSDKIVDVSVRGTNKYSHCTLAIFLGAARYRKNHLKALQNLIPEGGKRRSVEELEKARHIENMYQFCLRTAIRQDPNAQVKLVLPTAGDAKALAERIGLSCTPQLIKQGSKN